MTVVSFETLEELKCSEFPSLESFYEAFYYIEDFPNHLHFAITVKLPYSGHFPRDLMKSWSNSHNKTSLYRVLYSGHLYIADTILWSQQNVSLITNLLLADRPKYWSNKTNFSCLKIFLFNLFQTTIYILR